MTLGQKISPLAIDSERPFGYDRYMDTERKEREMDRIGTYLLDGYRAGDFELHEPGSKQAIAEFFEIGVRARDEEFWTDAESWQMFEVAA